VSNAALIALLRDVLPRDDLYVGTVVTDAAAVAGTVLVQLANGGTARYRGSATVGDAVFVRSGEIRGTVSGLTPFADQDV
jgi:hypothetical protein